MLAIEYTGLKCNMKDNFASLKRTYGWKIGINRYSAIHSSFEFTIEQLQDIFNQIRSSFQKYWDPGSIMIIDESLYAYKPKNTTIAKIENTEPIPVVYIPRKPHPNGLLNFLFATKSSNTGLPYVIDFQPHLTHPQLTPSEIVRLFVARWTYSHSPIIVGDSKIIGFKLVNELMEQGIRSTFSCSVNDHSFHMKLLLSNYSVQSHEILISCLKGESDGMSRNHLLILWRMYCRSNRSQRATKQL